MLVDKLTDRETHIRAYLDTALRPLLSRKRSNDWRTG